ncbi:MAG: helix-turn-helix domain-containing protein [Blautia sp.]|nr:helix-turn-helix domain-containing protein [Blautia sp.]
MIRMLVVEDEQVIRNGLLRHVPWKDLGVDEVRGAANAGEALALLSSFPVDIISSDIRMPGMTGVELCAKVRESLPDVEIIFLTGYSDKDYLRAAINLHAVRYVEKPILMDEYAQAVREAIKNVEKSRVHRSLSGGSIEEEGIPVQTVERAAMLMQGEEGASYTIRKASDYIISHYGERDLSIKVIGEYVGLSPTYLSSLFKKETGTTIGQFLMDVRIDRAKQLMKDPQKKLYEIAEQVGYEDVGYFTRVFKRACGVTPSEYRRKQVSL